MGIRADRPAPKSRPVSDVCKNLCKSGNISARAVWEILKSQTRAIFLGKRG